MSPLGVWMIRTLHSPTTLPTLQVHHGVELKLPCMSLVHCGPKPTYIIELIPV